MALVSPPSWPQPSATRSSSRWRISPAACSPISKTTASLGCSSIFTKSKILTRSLVQCTTTSAFSSAPRSLSEHSDSMMPRIPTRSEAGVSLIVTLVIAAGISVLVGGVLYFTSTKTTLTRRVSQYDCSVAAGVAATEKVVTRITKDFQVSGETSVLNNISTYQGLVPTADELYAALKS